MPLHVKFCLINLFYILLQYYPVPLLVRRFMARSLRLITTQEVLSHSLVIQDILCTDLHLEPVREVHGLEATHSAQVAQITRVFFSLQ